MADYEIVVSADNNQWLEWQAMLFHHSCLRQLGRAPIIVVHGDGELRSGYRMIQATAGRIQRAPSFRSVAGQDYSPRNTVGTLQSVMTDASYMVLCDADMIFLRDERFEGLRLNSLEISADRSTYLRVNCETRELLALACARAGVALGALEQHPIDANVPLVVPASLRYTLAHDWLSCIDLILGLPASGTFLPAVRWLTSMWALVLAVSRLGLGVITTDFTLANVPGIPPLPPDPKRGPAMVHYCYGDDVFDKKRFHGLPEVCERIWQLERVGGSSVAARIREEICLARDFYRSVAGA